MKSVVKVVPQRSNITTQNLVAFNFDFKTKQRCFGKTGNRMRGTKRETGRRIRGTKREKRARPIIKKKHQTDFRVLMFLLILF